MKVFKNIFLFFLLTLLVSSCSCKKSGEVPFEEVEENALILNEAIEKSKNQLNYLMRFDEDDNSLFYRKTTLTNKVQYVFQNKNELYFEYRDFSSQLLEIKNFKRIDNQNYYKVNTNKKNDFSFDVFLVREGASNIEKETTEDYLIIKLIDLNQDIYFYINDYKIIEKIRFISENKISETIINYNQLAIYREPDSIDELGVYNLINDSFNNTDNLEFYEIDSDLFTYQSKKNPQTNKEIIKFSDKLIFNYYNYASKFVRSDCYLKEENGEFTLSEEECEFAFDFKDLLIEYDNNYETSLNFIDNKRVIETSRIVDEELIEIEIIINESNLLERINYKNVISGNLLFSYKQENEIQEPNYLLKENLKNLLNSVIKNSREASEYEITATVLNSSIKVQKITSLENIKYFIQENKDLNVFITNLDDELIYAKSYIGDNYNNYALNQETMQFAIIFNELIPSNYDFVVLNYDEENQIIKINEYNGYYSNIKELYLTANFKIEKIKITSADFMDRTLLVQYQIDDLLEEPIITLTQEEITLQLDQIFINTGNEASYQICSTNFNTDFIIEKTSNDEGYKIAYKFDNNIVYYYYDFDDLLLLTKTYLKQENGEYHLTENNIEFFNVLLEIKNMSKEENVYFLKNNDDMIILRILEEGIVAFFEISFNEESIIELIEVKHSDVFAFITINYEGFTSLIEIIE